MIKMIFFSLWGCAIAGGTLFYLYQPAEQTEEEKMKMEMEVAEQQERSSFTTPFLMVTPVLSDSKVGGILFMQLSAEIKDRALYETDTPQDLILQDAFNAFIIGNKDFAMPKVQTFDPHKFKKGFKASLEGTLGENMVGDVLLTSINFLRTNETREKQTLESIYVQEDPSVWSLVQKRNAKAEEKKKKKKEKYKKKKEEMDSQAEQ